tara:strand:- start:706 stop:1182 length:477 start_codon:yes stop_codon:yes gene_type:complete
MEKDMKVHILDGVFQPHQLTYWQKSIEQGNNWFETLEYHKNYAMCHAILDIVKKYFSLENMKGYEYWTHIDTKPVDWHYDKDEIAYKQGFKRFPICSSVFYIEADCIGGYLEFDNKIKVKPITNRLVLFSPKLYHGVEDFTGKRTSININPWNKPLYK